MTIEPLGEDGGLPAARHHHRGAAGRAGGGAGDRALAAAENRAEHRAADRRAADLARALARRRIAFTVDRFGAQRHLASARQHHGVEADPEPRALLHLAAALDERHRADHARAGRHRQPSVRIDVARDARIDAIFEPRPFAADGVSISRPITDEAGMTTSVRTGSGRVGAAVSDRRRRPLRDRNRSRVRAGVGGGAVSTRAGAASADAGARSPPGPSAAAVHAPAAAPCAGGSREPDAAVRPRASVRVPAPARRLRLRRLDDAFCFVHRLVPSVEPGAGTAGMPPWRPARGASATGAASSAESDIRSAGARP